MDRLFFSANNNTINKHKFQQRAVIFLNLRTDLALERHEIAGSSEIDGVILKKYKTKTVTVTEIEITNENGEKALDKPKGKYITLDVTPFTRVGDLFSPELEVLSSMIRKLLPKSKKSILVVGLGNESITSDALGPLTAQMVFATRHIGSELAKSIGFEKLRSVADIIPGVLGKTGIETGEIVESVVKKIDPAAVIAVDALAARRLERLGTTVQMATSGVSPGSGVGNARSCLDEKHLGVPVLSIGVPTVVDGATLAFDLIEKAGIKENESLSREMLRPFGEGIMVSPKEIDLMIQRASQFIAMGINCALQRSLDPKDILAIVS